METMTLQELAQSLADSKKLELSVARSFVSTMFDVIRIAIERDKLVKVKGLGTFKLIEVGARESVSVNSGERVLLSSYGKITFTPDSIMKEIVNKPFSQFETVVLNDGVEFDDMEPDASTEVSEPEILPDDDIKQFKHAAVQQIRGFSGQYIGRCCRRLLSMTAVICYCRQ